MFSRLLRKALKRSFVFRNRCSGNDRKDSTDSPSRIMQDAEEYWENSETEDQLRDLSHWAGHGRWSDEQAWRKIGDHHFDMAGQLRALATNGPPPGTLLEWGPGGGANAVRFADASQVIYGVDISQPNLTECGRQLAKRRFEAFRPCLIPADHPEHVLQLVNEPVDLFLSTAVYQHFPSKEYGVQVTSLASQLLREGGLGLIQIRYDDGDARFRPKWRDYKRNAVTFTSYHISEFWGILEDAGLSPLAVQLKTENNYAYFFCQKGTSA